MKTKRTRCQVSGARCQGAHLGWEVPAGALETCGAKKTTFQAGICMKIRTPVRSPKSEGLSGGCADSDSRLLAPDSCRSRNEGATGDVVENKRERPKSGVRSQKSKGLCGGCADSDSRLLAPDTYPSRNEGSSGYIDENTSGQEITDHQKGEQMRSPRSGVHKMPTRGPGIRAPVLPTHGS